VSVNGPSAIAAQGLSADKFQYFFLGLRKGEIRRRVGALRARYPDETPEQLSHRLIAAQRPLSVLGGALLELPTLLPGLAPALKLLGIAGAASTLVRVNMSMLLEIALVHGHDIDDRARLREMLVVVTTTALASGAPSLAGVRALRAPASLAAGTAAALAASELIGRSAIAYYGRQARDACETGAPGSI